jgi:hypothetical protein
MYASVNFLSRRFETQSVRSLSVCLFVCLSLSLSLHTHTHTHTHLHGLATDMTANLLWGFFKSVHNLELIEFDLIV